MVEPRKNHGRKRVARHKTLPKTDAEKLEEHIDLILKRSGGILDRAKRFEVTKAITMSVYGALASRFDELSKGAAIDMSFDAPPPQTRPLPHPVDGQNSGEGR